MLTVVCFLWHDPERADNSRYTYGPDYVNRLQSMLDRHLSLPHELVCCTDNATGIDPAIRIVRMPPEVYGLGTYNRKLYAFHPEAAEILGPRILMIDLDVVIVGIIDAVVDRHEPFVAWEQVEGNKGRFNTSMVLMDAGAYPEVWTDFDANESLRQIEQLGYWPVEQDWVSFKLDNKGATWPRTGGAVISYQRHRHAPLPDAAKIVFFNGRVAPGVAQCQQESPWIRECWR